MPTRQAGSYVYADPEIGAVAGNLGKMLFGDPAQAGVSAYRRAEADKADTEARILRQGAIARSRAGAGLADLFAPPGEGEDADTHFRNAIATVGQNLLQGSKAGAGDGTKAISDLASLFYALQPGGDSARRSLVIGGHMPTKDFAPDAATADANAQRDADYHFRDVKYGADSTAATARRGQDITANTTRRGQDLTAGTARDVATIHETGATERERGKPVTTAAGATTTFAPGDPRAAGPTIKGAPTVDTVKGGALQDYLNANPDSVASLFFDPKTVGRDASLVGVPGDPRLGATGRVEGLATEAGVKGDIARKIERNEPVSDDERRLAGVAVKEGAGRAGGVIKLRPDEIAVSADGKLIAEGKPGNSARTGAKPVRVGPYDSVVGPDGAVLYKGAEKPAPAVKSVKMDDKALGAIEGRIAEALGVEPSDLVKMISGLTGPELERYNEAVSGGYQRDGGSIPYAVSGGADALRGLFDVTPGRLYGVNIKRRPAAPPATQPVGTPLAPAANAAPRVDLSRIPPAAIQHLRQNPQLAPAFDEKYGAGAATMALGGA